MPLIQARLPEVAGGIGRLEVSELRQKDHHGEAVDEADHHRERHHADELAELQEPERDLQHAHQHHGGEQIFDAVGHDQRHHHHRQGASRTRDHARAPPEGRRDEPDKEGGVQAHQRVHMGDKGKGDRLGDQGQRHG